ncbi:MAG TPA: SH3 domain-containing protein [Pyrinomonadaceae bacterium]|jgi:hypothetical protein|nr:SH3 domain-containing protein [Pyrinomonadaceae bacterium]
MKLPLIFVCSLIIITSFAPADAQKRRAVRTFREQSQINSSAVVIDETLSVLRTRPSLFAPAIQRMRRGRKVMISGMKEADGVTFYKIAAAPSGTGWVQADAVFGRFRPHDDERLAKLVQASDGFDQIEIAEQFFEFYPDSPLRPSLLLLYGDLLEEIASKLSRDAAGRLRRPEMAASGAPLHSYYLNFVSLDRYRKLGVTFLFNTGTRKFHYNGDSWREIAAKFPKSAEAVEAQKRLDLLKQKMEAVGTK